MATTSNASNAASLAEQLLDAQVRFHLAKLEGDQLTATVTTLAGDLFAASSRHQLADLIPRDPIKAIVARALTTVPASAGVSGFVELTSDVVREAVRQGFPLAEVIERESVEAVLDELLALTPLLETLLERLTASPLVGTMASGFMGRIVGEVLAANKAVADKVPGLGSLMAFGTSAASMVVGAADKQFEGLIGETVGKGGTFAVRRLNRILIETLQDPTTRAAVLEVWDLAARQNATGLGDVPRAEIGGLIDAVHDLVIATAANEHTQALGDDLVDGFFERFGGYTPTELLDELDLDREDLIADLILLAPGVVDALKETGDLEKIIRTQLEPFYASAEVKALLG